MFVKYSSSIVASGFLGLESLNDKLREIPLAEAILKLLIMGTKAFQDSILMILGEKFV